MALFNRMVDPLVAELVPALRGEFENLPTEEELTTFLKAKVTEIFGSKIATAATTGAAKATAAPRAKRPDGVPAKKTSKTVFKDENRERVTDEIKEQMPGAKAADIAKAVTAQLDAEWKDCSEDVKNEYQDKASAINVENGHPPMKAAEKRASKSGSK